ncbi:MAG TPA: hypothetical protein VHN14_29095 [Kofleriaceae bacterium]|nr:hypothetical protein [Kofleriaceae bacterium]
MLLTWLTAFTWTLAIELPIYALAIGRCFARWWSVVVVVLAINLVTHPMLWFVFPRITPRWLYVAVGEVTVTAIEAALVALAIRRPGRAVAAAVAANLASFAAGPLLWALVG